MKKLNKQELQNILDELKTITCEDCDKSGHIGYWKHPIIDEIIGPICVNCINTAVAPRFVGKLANFDMD